jgi:hypothetical protein
MAKVTLMPGPCGLVSIIEAQKTDRRTIAVKLTTECGNYKPLEEELTEVNAFDEVLGKLARAKYTSFAASIPNTRPVRCLAPSSRRSKSRPAWRCPKT